MSNKGIYGFSDWDNAFLNQQEKDYITGLRQQAEAGQISWATANKAAESIRGKYGYAGGAAGDDYIEKPVSIDTQYDNFEKRAEIDRQKQKVLGSTFEEFTQGDDYAALLDKYTTAGKRAMDDTIGTVASRTGGMASSYAQTAGQQAFNQYMEGLDDAARELYQQEYEKEKARLQMLQDEEAQDYSRFLDNISIQTGERDHRREVAQSILDQNNYETEYADSRKDTEWNQDITEAEITGYMPDGTPIYSTLQDEEADAQTEVSNAQEQVAALLSQGKTIADIDPVLVAKAKEGITGWSDDYLALLESQGQQTGTYPYASDVPADEGDEWITSMLALYPDGIVPAADWNALTAEEQAKLEAAGLTREIDTRRNVNGMKASSWDMVKDNAAALARTKNWSEVDKYMVQVVADMSIAQREEIMSMLYSMGYPKN